MKNSENCNKIKCGLMYNGGLSKTSSQTSGRKNWDLVKEKLGNVKQRIFGIRQQSRNCDDNTGKADDRLLLKSGLDHIGICSF